jgi:Fe2+ or Zn2+ uptake regulation protein
VDDARNIFAAHGLRHTRQRETVFAALTAATSHPTAEELFQIVSASPDGAVLSLATVYNTLEALTTRGLCRRIPCPGGVCRFDADTHDHVHLASADGGLADIPEDLSRKLLAALPHAALAEVERRLGVRVAGVTVQVVAAPPRD